jgi:hypothetical protein
VTQTYPQYTPPQYPQQPTQGASLPAVPPPPPQLSTGGTGGAWPKMRNLVDRLIIVEPIRVDETATDDDGKPRPEAYFHLTVCNGGPLRYGDSEKEDDPRPATHEIDTPCRFTNANSYNYGFVQAVRDSLAAGEPGRIGVVQRGTRGKKPYLITRPGTDVLGNARPNGDALFAEGMAIWTRIWNARHGGEPFTSPTPRSLVAAPAQPAPQVSYQQPAQSPYMPQGIATPNDGNGVPQGYAFQGYQPQQQPTYAPQQPQQGYTPGVPGQYGQPQPSALTQAVGPELQAMAQQLPPGVEAWLASLPADQQAGARAQFLAQQAQPSGPGI